MKTVNTGSYGEELASKELIRLGYKILGRNWKTKISEVDIIVLKNDVVYFVEVKYRQTSRQGDGLDYITGTKLNHMKRAADLWVMNSNWQGEYVLMAASVNGESKSVDIREIV